MKKAKKFLLNLLAFASVSAFALSSFACDNKHVGTGGINNGLGGLGGSSSNGNNNQNGNTHAHTFNQTIVDKKYLKSQATCTSKGVYYKSCICGDKGTETFTVYPLGHTSDDYCTRCNKSLISYGLEYRLVDNTHYIVTGIGSCTDTELYIPAEYNNLPVTAIGDRAFAMCDNLISVTIPKSITNILFDSFSLCYSLENIYYTGDIESWCAITSPLYIMENDVNLYINYELIEGDLIIPDGVNVISEGAFYGCRNITSVTFPESLTEIGQHAFSYCSNLKSVTMNKSIEIIEPRAFWYCESLTNITIPSSVSYIGTHAFKYCTKLTNIKFQDTSTWYRTDDYGDWQNKVNGTQVDVSNSSQNATYFTDKYSNYYWYKL